MLGEVSYLLIIIDWYLDWDLIITIISLIIALISTAVSFYLYRWRLLSSFLVRLGKRRLPMLSLEDRPSLYLDLESGRVRAWRADNRKNTSRTVISRFNTVA